jgi:hypothetical protein
MQAPAVAMTLAGAKVLQFLQLPLYLLDFATAAAFFAALSKRDRMSPLLFMVQ